MPCALLRCNRPLGEAIPAGLNAPRGDHGGRPGGGGGFSHSLERLRYMRIGYARVSKADGSQSLDLQRDALRAVSWMNPAVPDHPTVISLRGTSGLSSRSCTSSGALQFVQSGHSESI